MRVTELIEDGVKPRFVEDFALSDDTYGHALDNLVQANVDVIPHDGNGRVLLGLRRDPPLHTTLWVFGGRMKFGESIVDTARRGLSRELGIAAVEDRLRMCGLYNVRWNTRTAPPAGNGFQTLLITMAYRCEDHEIADIAARDGTHDWVRWFALATVLAGDVKPWAVHEFLPLVLRDAGLQAE